MNMFSVLVFDYIVCFKSFAYLNKKIAYFQKYAYILHIIFAIIMIILHLIYYVNSHEKNYFELIGLKRLFSEEQLEQVYSRKMERMKEEIGMVPGTKEKIDKLNKIYGTLNHAILCQIYDKYGKEDSRQEDLFLNSFNIASLLQDLCEYLVVLIALNIVTKDENLKGSRKWMSAVMLMFFSNEIDMYLRRREQFDWFFDNQFPQFSIFDRIRLIRCCMIPILLTIRLNYQLFNKTSFFKVSDQIQQTLNTHEALSKKLNGYNYTDPLVSIRKNFEKSIENINKEHKNIKEKELTKKSWCAQCCKIIFYLMMGLVVLAFFADKNFEIIDKAHYSDED